MTRTLTFARPLAGLPETTDCTLEVVPGARGLHTLHGASGAPRLFLVDAAACLPGYSPMLTDDQARALGLERPEDAELYVVANPSQQPTTVNLLAPIVVNRSTGAAAQVILDGQGWPLDAELGALLAG